MKQSLHVFLLFIALTIPFSMNGQCPTGETITLGGQDDIDQFLIDYPNCTKLEVNLRFVNSFSNFNGLSNIDTIMGWISFYDDPYIASLEGFENLKYVSGSIDFDEVKGLLDFQGFNNLEYIGGSLDVDEPSVFESTEGLDNLKFIGGDLEIDEADSIKIMTGFPVLETIGGTLRISDTRYLEEIDAFPVLTSIGSVYINDNDTLSSIKLIENLVTIDSFFEISWNRNLEDLLGFSALTSINAEVVIVMNNKLTSLEGLNNISPNAITDLIITGSDSLSFCSVQSICDYLTMNLGPSEIGMNKMGCNTSAEITNICLGTTSIEVIDKYNIKVFPNPSNGTFTISFDEYTLPFNLKIFDQRGGIAYTENNTLGNIQIDHLAKGIYVIHISSNEFNFTKKIIIL